MIMTEGMIILKKYGFMNSDQEISFGALLPGLPELL